jgi:hypothetical protein
LRRGCFAKAVGHRGESVVGNRRNEIHDGGVYANYDSELGNSLYAFGIRDDYGSKTRWNLAKFLEASIDQGVAAE